MCARVERKDLELGSMGDNTGGIRRGREGGSGVDTIPMCEVLKTK